MFKNKINNVLLLVYRSVFFIIGLNELVQAENRQLNYLVVDSIASPFQITQAGISKGGIITDIVNELFQDSSYQLNTKVFPIKRIYKTLEVGMKEIWIAYDAKPWKSLSYWGNFIHIPLFSIKHSLLTCSDSLKRIDSADSLEASTLAVLKNFRYPELKTLQKQHRLALYPVSDYVSGFHMVQLKRLSGFVEMDVRLRYNLANFKPKAPCFRFLNMDKIIAPYDIYLSVSKSASTKLKTFIKTGLLSLQNNGKIKAIIHRYEM
jgi:polar amino acid transport system substrate-binding protein